MPEVYPNGISTSLPPDVQERLVHSIVGLERAVMLRPGYAVEYDYVDPQQLSPTLELQGAAGALPGRADQRHLGLRGGRGAGPAGRDQRGGEP